VAAISDKPNVLLITADDLNNWVNYAGNPQVITPNLDRLLAMGVFFNRSYANAPACNPSRASFMSSLRPSSTGVYDNDDDWRTVLPEEKMLTTAFRNAGYYAYGAGKVYHIKFERESEWDDYMHRYNTKKCDIEPGELFVDDKLEFGPLLCDDDKTEDYHVISYGIQQLSKTHDKPIFLALGFRKPHLPWYVPKKYYDLYPLESIKLPTTLINDLDDIPFIGVQLAEQKLHEDVVKRDLWTRAVRAYLASISFVDAQIGRLLAALDKSPLKNDTIVVFLGDHGYHLGEKEHWSKFTLWEEATKAPLMFAVPGLTQPGQVCDRTVEFLSIYPTLLDLCGIASPDHVEGTSIKSLITNPGSGWNLPAVSTYRQNNHAVRNESWRYIGYFDGGEELYNEVEDPYEWTNLLYTKKNSSSNRVPQKLRSVKSELRQFFPSINKVKLTPEQSKNESSDFTDSSSDSSEGAEDTSNNFTLVIALTTCLGVTTFIGLVWFAKKKLQNRLLQVLL